MTTSGLAAPSRAAPRRSPRPRPGPSRAAPPAARDRGSFERILAWSLAASVFAHLLVLLFSPLFIQTVNPPAGAVGTTPRQASDFGLEMVIAIPSENAPEIPVVEAPPSEQPLFETPAARPETGGTQPADGPVAPGPVETQPSPGRAGDGLRPGTRDPRLYVRPNPLGSIDNRSDFERYNEHLQARLDAVNDSMGIAAARNSQTSDWTVTDAAGNRWGLSPEGLHLGGVTIPAPLLPRPAPTGDNASREAAREEQRQREDIQRQEADRERRDTQQERTDATRAAQDAQRQGQGGDDGS
jgi:hypothetical protein